MARREVVIINATREAATKVEGRANFDEIRVEIRLILPPQVSWFEVNETLTDAVCQARDKLDARYPY